MSNEKHGRVLRRRLANLGEDIVVGEEREESELIEKQRVVASNIGTRKFIKKKKTTISKIRLSIAA